MRRTVSVVVGLAIFACCASPGWATTPAPPVALNLTPFDEQRQAIVPGLPGTLGRTWGFRGQLRTTAGPRWGSYRATCVWLGRKWSVGKYDDRVSCTIVLTARVTPSGTIVAQGLLKRPRDGEGLFKRAHECSKTWRNSAQTCHPRLVPVTGGTGRYRDVVSQRHFLDLSIADQVSVRHVT